MTVAIQARPPRFIPSATSLKRFTVDEYHRMIEAGAFEDDQPVELLEGWIVYQMGHNPPHDVVVKLVAMLLDRAIPGTWHTRTQSSITTTDSEPLPDVAVVAGTPRDYLSRHPSSQDIALVVEVSDASLDRDRREKAPLYARAGISTYWIVNLQESTIEVHTDPTGPDPQPRYRATTRHGIADAVPLLIPAQPPASIPVKDLLP
jgi:Uma2 family endonuclease